MTLKEKFVEQSNHIRYQVLETEKFEKIADDYAIEFCDWMSENYSSYYHELSIWNKDHKKYSKKELLEIFKKEKNL